MHDALDRGRGLWTTVLVAGVAWAAHFLFFWRFGLYEDDFLVVAPQLEWSWRDAVSSLQHIVTTLYQGRPIGFLIANLVPFAGFQLGGVHALPLVYLAGSVIVVANALLAHRLLIVTYGPSFAFLGAVAFTLYPADTTHSFLTHTLVLQPTLTLLLLALIAYLRKRYVLAYALAASCLLTYESGVLAFFAAPLLEPLGGSGLLRRWVRHAAVLLVIVTAVLALRVMVGEYRAVDLEHSDQGITWNQVPPRVLEALWTGPQVSLSAFVTRPGWAILQNWNSGLGLGVVAAFSVFFATMARHEFVAGLPTTPVLRRAAITGVVMVIGGYAFEFSGWHFPPIHKAGRMSAVHLGATLGAAILMASLLCMPWTLVRRKWMRVTLGAAAALYLASVFGYRLVVQRGFVDATAQQRQYWSTIVTLIPDLSADTVIILLGSEPPRNRFIMPSSWSDTWVIRYLFHDAQGRSPYLVGGRFSLHRDAPPAGFEESLLQARDGRLWWSPAAPAWLRIDRAQSLQRDRLVVLEQRGFTWVRRAGSITLAGIAIDLRPAAAQATIRLLPGALHDLLLAPANVTPAR